MYLLCLKKDCTTKLHTNEHRITKNALEVLIDTKAKHYFKNSLPEIWCPLWTKRSREPWTAGRPILLCMTPHGHSCTLCSRMSEGADQWYSARGPCCPQDEQQSLGTFLRALIGELLLESTGRRQGCDKHKDSPLRHRQLLSVNSAEWGNPALQDHSPLPINPLE